MVKDPSPWPDLDQKLLFAVRQVRQTGGSWGDVVKLLSRFHSNLTVYAVRGRAIRLGMNLRGIAKKGPAVEPKPERQKEPWEFYPRDTYRKQILPGVSTLPKLPSEE